MLQGENSLVKIVEASLVIFWMLLVLSGTTLIVTDIAKKQISNICEG